MKSVCGVQPGSCKKPELHVARRKIREPEVPPETRFVAVDAKCDYSAKGCRRRRDAIAARGQIPLHVHGNGDPGVRTTGRRSAGSSWYWQIQAQTAEIDLMEAVARHIAHDIIRERLESNTEAD